MSNAQDKSGFVANEPVVVAHLVLWLLANVGAFVIGHTHLFTTVQWDSFTTSLVPLITAVVLSVSAVFWRKYVTPVWKTVESDLEKVGVPQALIDATVQSLITSLSNQITNLPTSTVVNNVAADANPPALKVLSDEELAQQRPAHAG